jgi:hypothetical protein
VKIGEIIEVEGVKYIAENAISKNGINCFACSFYNINCGKIVKETNCVKNKIIFVKIPLELLRKIEQLEKQIELMKNCDNYDWEFQNGR